MNFDPKALGIKKVLLTMSHGCISETVPPHAGADQWRTTICGGIVEVDRYHS